MSIPHTNEDVLRNRLIDLGRSRQVIIFLAIIVALTLTGCSSLDEAINQAKKYVPADWKLVYTETVREDTAIVFYTRDEDLGAGLFQKDKLGWNWSGSTLGPLVSEPKGIAWRHADLSNENKGPFSIYYGVIRNPEITNVTVETASGNILQSKIITEQGMTIWYVISEGQILSTNSIIKGLSKDGKVLYEFKQSRKK